MLFFEPRKQPKPLSIQQRIGQLHLAKAWPEVAARAEQSKEVEGLDAIVSILEHAWVSLFNDFLEREYMEHVAWRSRDAQRLSSL
jgi:hypothetical protein